MGGGRERQRKCSSTVVGVKEVWVKGVTQRCTRCDRQGNRCHRSGVQRGVMGEETDVISHVERGVTGGGTGVIGQVYKRV